MEDTDSLTDAIFSKMLDGLPAKLEVKFCPYCGTELIQTEIDGRVRPNCPEVDCHYVFWDHPIPVVLAIVEHGGHIILARQQGWPEQLFALIAGLLESGEAAEAGILREVREELGVEGEIASFVGVYPFVEMNQIMMVYHVRTQGKVQVSDELAEIKYVAPDELRPWTMGAGPAVADWLRKRQARTG